MLSSRPDLVGDRITRPLARLRDDLHPLSVGTIIEIIEEDCGAPLNQLFTQFTREPLATGSIAQVHIATLKRGLVVAVKVRRPFLEKQLALDFALLRGIGGLLEWTPGLSSVPFVDLFRELEVAIRMQLDFKREANNHQRFAQNLGKLSHVCVPRLVPELCHDSVITMEYISELKPLGALCLSSKARRAAAKTGLRALYQMIFVDGLVHADLHPGNVLFRPDGDVVLMDFGLVATLDSELREQFGEFFFAMATNQGGLCAKIVQQTAQAIAPGFNEACYKAAMTKMVERYAGRQVRDFEVARFAAELFDLQRRFGIRGSTAFTMTIISLLLFECTLKELDPELDFQMEATNFMLTLPPKALDHAKRASVFTELRNSWQE
jgi:ubiquinone biosynthesis protein